MRAAFLLLALVSSSTALQFGGVGAAKKPIIRKASKFAGKVVPSGRAAMTPPATEEREVSDLETGLRWIGVQGTVDSTIILAFAYDLRRKLGEDLPFDVFVQKALEEPGLKFLILMPAVTIFFQILRRFGSEDGVVVRDGTFEDDPIVKFLGGATKVRSIRNRWLELVTVKGK